MSQFESPLRYPGGKASLFPFLSNLLSNNKLIGVDYAEPYAGGAGLALKLLFNEFVSNIRINDLDYSIYSFWKALLESNGRFCDWIEDVKVSVDNWQYYKGIQKSSTGFSSFEIAQSTFYLNRTNISGVIKGGPIGGIKQKGKYKIDARFNKSDLISRIERISKFSSRISITNLDGLSFINHVNSKQSNTFIYIDPPYVQKGAGLYMNYFQKKDHIKLSKKINQITQPWLVSYDNHDLILNLYEKRQKLVYQISQSTSNRIGNEILIFPDKLQYEQSLECLTNPILI